MMRQKESFLEILMVELKDLESDIRVLVEKCGRDREEGKLTNYVCWENQCVFKQELLGLDVFRSLLNETAPERFESLEEMVVFLKASMRERIRACCLYEAITGFIDRKLSKVEHYVAGQPFKASVEGAA
ncbi:MAG: hypothetical protein WA705_10825 [Candidatus Ozemobacteraceae bacterium]